MYSVAICYIITIFRFTNLTNKPQPLADLHFRWHGATYGAFALPQGVEE